MEALWQEGLRTGKGAFTVNPYRPGELLRGKKSVQTGKYPTVGVVVGRTGYDADIGVAHDGVLFMKR